jgi:hypothetical protein
MLSVGAVAPGTFSFEGQLPLSGELLIDGAGIFGRRN